MFITIICYYRFCLPFLLYFFFILLSRFPISRSRNFRSRNFFYLYGSTKLARYEAIIGNGSKLTQLLDNARVVTLNVIR